MGNWDTNNRPDKIGVVPNSREIPNLGWTLSLWGEDDTALQSEHTKRVTRQELKQGKAVMHVPPTGSVILYLPRGKRFNILELNFLFGKRRVEIIPFAKNRF